jgi:hypothetical protein
MHPRCHWDGESEFLKVAENKGFEKLEAKLDGENLKVNSPTHWMIVNTLTTCLSEWRALRKNGEPRGNGRRRRGSRSWGQRQVSPRMHYERLSNDGLYQIPH